MINHTFNTTTISTGEDSVNTLRAELDSLLRTLELVIRLNSLGKSKQIADEIEPILKHYNRNQQ